MTRRLVVWWNGARVGLLALNAYGEPEFSYAEDWLANPDARPVSASLPYVDAPRGASRILNNSDCGLGTVVCPASEMRHSFIRRGPIWCTWIGSKSLQRARSPSFGTGFSDPAFNDLCPYVVCRPHRTDQGYPQIALSSAGSAEPGYSVSGTLSPPGSFPFQAVILLPQSPPACGRSPP